MLNNTSHKELRNFNLLSPHSAGMPPNRGCDCVVLLPPHFFLFSLFSKENRDLAAGIPESRMQNASYFYHLLSWWEHREDPDVLFLFYEGVCVCV
jgi:hypothetical protein